MLLTALDSLRRRFFLIFGLTGDRKHGRWPEVLITASVALLLVSFALSAGDVTTYGGVDLRGRITAARALLLGMDPYFYQWHPGMSDYLLDPCRGREIMSRGTVSPPTLWIYSLTARLPYRTIRWLWFGSDWLTLLATVLLLTRLPVQRDDLTRAFTVVCGFAFIGSSQIWRMHVERGQFYIYYSLLLALAFYYAGRQARSGPWLAGFAIGLGAALRPTLAVVAVPALLRGKWAVVGGAALGVVLVMAVTLPATGVQAWTSFRQNAADADKAYLLRYKYLDPNLGNDSPDLLTSAPGVAVDQVSHVVEGMNCFEIWQTYLMQDYSFLGVSNQMLWLDHHILMGHRGFPPGADPRLKILRCAYLAICGGFFLWLLWRRPSYSLSLLLLIGLFLSVLGDYMIVPTRGLYAEVHQIVVYALLGTFLLRPGGLDRDVKALGWLGIAWALPLFVLGNLSYGPRTVFSPLSDLGPYAALAFFLWTLLYVLREAAQGRGPYALAADPGTAGEEQG
jgi:hypothetical protein